MAIKTGFDAAKPVILLAALTCILSSCVPHPPGVEILAAKDLQKEFRPAHRSQDICQIYRAMFPASVISPIGDFFGDPRISTQTEAANAPPAEIAAIRAALIGNHGEGGFPWRSIPEGEFSRAFRSWRHRELPHCDWQGYAREVSAPAKNGQIGKVLTTDETGSYTRVSEPYFLGPDSAVVLVSELRDQTYLQRKLVFTYRDGPGWAMIPHVF